MDAVRSTARLLTQAAVVTVTVAECVAASVYRCAVDRAHRAQPQGDGTRARDHDEGVT
jgi:hypothetical protein